MLLLSKSMMDAAVILELGRRCYKCQNPLRKDDAIILQPDQVGERYVVFHYKCWGRV